MSAELGSAQASVSQEERLIHDITERIRTRYTLLVPIPSASYRDCPNAQLADSQLWGEYPGGYGVCVVDVVHSLNLEEADSDEKCGGPTTFSEGDCHVIAVHPPPPS